MEPSDLNSTSSDDVRLHHLLREACPELPDDGFSLRVLAALPARRRTPRPSARLVAIGLGALLGGAFAAYYEGTPKAGEWAAVTSEWAESAARLASFVQNPNHLLALIVTALALGFAFKAGGGQFADAGK